MIWINFNLLNLLLKSITSVSLIRDGWCSKLKESDSDLHEGLSKEKLLMCKMQDLDSNIDISIALSTIVDSVIKDIYHINNFLKSEILFIPIDINILNSISSLVNNIQSHRVAGKYQVKLNEYLSLDKLKCLILYSIVHNILPRLKDDFEISDTLLFSFKDKTFVLCRDKTIKKILSSYQWCKYNSFRLKNITDKSYLSNIAEFIASDSPRTSEHCIFLIKNVIELIRSSALDRIYENSANRETKVYSFSLLINAKFDMLRNKNYEVLIRIIDLTDKKSKILDGIYDLTRRSKNKGKVSKQSLKNKFNYKIKAGDCVQFNEHVNNRAEIPDISLLIKLSPERSKSKLNTIHDSGLGQSLSKSYDEVEDGVKGFPHDNSFNNLGTCLFSSTTIDRDIDMSIEKDCKTRLFPLLGATNHKYSLNNISKDIAGSSKFMICIRRRKKNRHKSGNTRLKEGRGTRPESNGKIYKVIDQCKRSNTLKRKYFCRFLAKSSADEKSIFSKFNDNTRTEFKEPSGLKDTSCTGIHKSQIKIENPCLTKSGKYFILEKANRLGSTNPRSNSQTGCNSIGKSQSITLEGIKKSNDNSKNITMALLIAFIFFILFFGIALVLSRNIEKPMLLPVAFRNFSSAKGYYT